MTSYQADQFSSVAYSCLTLCDPMNCSTPGIPVHHQLPEFTQSQVHWVGDAIQSSHPLSSPSPPALNLSQHQGLFKWVSSSLRVKRWQEYTEELYKKDLHIPDNHNDVITHLKPNILDCKVKWALGSITTNKARGGDGIWAELFKILKDDAVKVLQSTCQQIWKTEQWPQDWKKVRFHSNPKERPCQRMFTPLHNCPHLTC